MSDKPNRAPTRKVAGASIGAACATVAVWLAQVAAGLDVPPGVEAALATLFAAASGYMVAE